MQPFSDEDASIETLSRCSSFSDATSVADEGKFVYASDFTVLWSVLVLVSVHPVMCTLKHTTQVCLKSPLQCFGF